MSEKTGFGVWLTGLPASGKTTLARGLAEAMRELGMPVQILDSDALREVLTPEPTYSAEERNWFYRVVAFIAQLLTQHGINVVIAATAHRRRYRDHARQVIGRFAQVHVRCSLQTCIGRDQKGIYQRAMTGEAETVPGLRVPYEPPGNPAVVVDTEVLSPAQGVQRIVAHLEEASFFPGDTNWRCRTEHYP